MKGKEQKITEKEREMEIRKEAMVETMRRIMKIKSTWAKNDSQQTRKVKNKKTCDFYGRTSHFEKDYKKKVSELEEKIQIIEGKQMTNRSMTLSRQQKW